MDFKMMAQLSAPPSLSFRNRSTIHCPNCSCDLLRNRHLCFDNFPSLEKIITAYFDGTLSTVKISTGIKHRYTKTRFFYPSDGSVETTQDTFDDKQEIKSTLDLDCEYQKCENEACRVYHDDDRKLAAFKQCQPKEYEQAMKKAARTANGNLSLEDLCWECLNGLGHKCRCGQSATLLQIYEARAKKDENEKRDPLDEPMQHKTMCNSVPVGARIRVAATCQMARGKKQRRRRLPRVSKLPSNMMTAIEVRCKNEPSPNVPRPHVQKWVRQIIGISAGAGTYNITAANILAQDQADYNASGVRYAEFRALRGRIWPVANINTTPPNIVVTDMTLQVRSLTLATSNTIQLQLVSSARGTATGHFSRPLAWVWSKIDQGASNNLASGNNLITIVFDTNFLGGEIIVDIEVVFVN